MDTEARRLRGIGMVLELLRNRWTFSVLVTLLEGPLDGRQLLISINEGAARNADLVGARVLHSNVLLARLRQMEKEGLLLVGQPGSDAGDGPDLWELTAEGKELFHSLRRVAAWAVGHRDRLAAALRKHRRGGVSGQLAVGEPVLTAEQDCRRGVGMALGVLHPRWAFAVLCQLSQGPQQPTGVTEAVNAGIDRNRDITGRRSLSEKMFWDTLHRLVDAGLVVHRPRPGQIASTARCTLTPAGHELLDALGPVGEWAIEHEEQLLTIVRRRRGLPDQDGA
ncbi:winged helix-turn-helix transcriptional regulator [Streptomyces acidiscabies]|uniref:winged helix-turn-helix transcriptional regulator n=1 Tax=Streptomyces acidiscabies TaxID=42234 RepID=UPI0009523938|nr:helix-turn-helix transcriptional regulator [Streptomyces acidiscabies]